MPAAFTVTSPGTTRHLVVGSPLGELTLVADDAGLAGLYFPGHWTRPDPASFGPRAGTGAEFGPAIAQLAEYFAGERREFSLPVHPVGSLLAQRAWALLRAIPYGQTTTYADLARQLGGITPREAGGLVGSNPVSIIIPCHRVVSSTGKLTGYAGGLKRKRHLLELEHAIAPAPATLW
jgi:methylated-DNA-[protein]-cysteine S-methyltransferase